MPAIASPNRNPPPRRSLFWTFAGAFLLVLLAAGLLQAVAIVALIEPIAQRSITDRAEFAARETASRIEALDPRSPEELVRILREESRQGPGFVLFRRQDGPIVSGRPLPPPARLALEAFLADSTKAGKAFPGFGRGSRWRSPNPRVRPQRDAELPFPDPGGSHPDREGGRFFVVARSAANLPSGATGEVVVLAPRGLLPFPGSAGTRRLLLFLPIAVLVAGVAGLVLFRILVRRLKAMETLARRVAAGDLSARVADKSGDEIGRLGAQLNLMAENLAQARDSLQESDRQRRRLLADISHELATPLTSIHGYTETLLSPEVALTETERGVYLRNVLEESERMDLLIKDLLDLARLEAGASDLKKERLDWTELSHNTMKRFQPLFAEAHLSLDWDGPFEAAWVEADGRRLEQVLDNLFGNALRYVPPGGRVLLSISQSGPADRVTHRLSVADDGPGIPEKDLPHVFDRFYRADASRTTAGSGLGLAIVKEIIARHGGSARASSRKPHGTMIQVELPAEPIAI